MKTKTKYIFKTYKKKKKQRGPTNIIVKELNAKSK